MTRLPRLTEFDPSALARARSVYVVAKAEEGEHAESAEATILPVCPYCPDVSTSSEQDPRALGVPKEVVDESARTLRNARKSLDTFLAELLGTTGPGTVAAADSTWVNRSDHRVRTARRQLLQWAGWNASLALSNIANHVIAIERTLQGEPVLTWPCVSLSRIVQEGAVRTGRLFDPAISTEERLTRIAAAWLDGARQQLTAAHELDPSVVPDAEEEWERAERTTQAAGMSIANDRRGRPNAAVFDAISVPFKVNVTDASGTKPTYPASWYRISSAATHSTLWLLGQAAGIGSGGELVVRADAETITASTLIVLGAFEDLTETLGTYYGREPRKAVTTLQRRMVAVIERQNQWREQMQEDLRALES